MLDDTSEKNVTKCNIFKTECMREENCSRVLAKLN